MTFLSILLEKATLKIAYVIILSLGITEYGCRGLALSHHAKDFYTEHHPSTSTDILTHSRLQYKNQRNTSPDLCPRDAAQFHLQGRTCLRKCTSDADCKSKRKKCLCDGACGFSCIKPEYCKYPGIENGRVVIVGNGLHDYIANVTNLTNNTQILFVCNTGYTLVHGPQRKTCIHGEWDNADTPRCDPSQYPSFRWFRSVRKKRRAIKAPGSRIVPHRPRGGGGGGGAPRRQNKKNRKPGEEDEYEFAPPVCDNLDHDEYIQTQVIQKGQAENETFSEGAIVKVSCTQGFGVNLPNGTVQCVDGKWKPKIPQCSALPCKVPYLIHGTFYNGSKALVFLEAVKHTKTVELRCSRGYLLRGPKFLNCWYGEWDVAEAPECVPGKDPSNVKRSCGSPPKEKGAIAYLEGKPIDYETEFRYPKTYFADATEIFYMCGPVKSRSRNRWKLKCEDGSWQGAALNCYGAINLEDDIQELTKMINSSCVYRNDDKHIDAFFQGVELTSESIEIPSNSLLISRCKDIGKYKLHGSSIRKCLSGQFLGITPSCEGLSQIYKYKLTRSPTILFRYFNGSIVQSNDGKLIVYPGTTLHLDCLWRRKFGTPSWHISNSHRVYPEGWAEDKQREPDLEYRLTIDNAQTYDSGIYSCHTPSRYSHDISVVVKRVECNPIPEQPDLEYSSTGTLIGTKVTIKCHNNTHELVGAQSILCTEYGNWSSPLPKCEYVECPDILLMSTLGNVNPTGKRNDTVLPVISVISRALGGNATFRCPPGYTMQGVPEAICQKNGNWSSAIPLCKVECQSPQPPDNGFVSGNPPYIAGDLAYFECNKGFIMDGKPFVTCQDSGTWSRFSVTKCVQACTYPGTAIGGIISTVKFYYSVGEAVTFDCTDGYQLLGARMLHCLGDGKWSTTVPTCVLPTHNTTIFLV